MNTTFRKTLIAGAIAALISSPALATNGLPGNAPAEGTAESGTEQPRDTSPQMNPSRDGNRDSYGTRGSTGAAGADRPQTGQHANDPSRMGRSPSEDASRAGVGDNPLYNRTPDDLNGMEVVGSDGEDIGEIKAVVSDSNQAKVHVVISSGGFLGLGDREILVSLDELRPIDSDKLQARFTQAQVETLPEYKSEQYTELESDRPISEFSAFEPTRDRTDPGMTGRDAQPAKRGGDTDPAMKGRDTGPSTGDRAPAQPGQPR